MKYIYSWIIFFLLTTYSFNSTAQNGVTGINYQAVARNTNGTVVANQALSVRISVLGGSPAGNVQYQETHQITTNQLGLFTLQIGKGSPVTGTFAAVPWTAANQFLKVEVATNNNNYVELGTTAFMSVPYALYAANATSGPQGTPGVKGDPGATGPTGPTGPIGPAGVAGNKGDKGDQGLTGLTGPQGIPGIPGTKGDKGDQGLIGLTGPQGIPGIPGTKGDKGDQGLTGLTGPQGIPGIPGTKGDKGDQGLTGLTGPQGIPGIKGDKGDPGIQGPAGLKGNTGATGPIGPVGPIGPIGLTGTPGSAGAPGAKGDQGLQGPAGANGLQGIQGIQGQVGPIGPIGPAGPTGPVGPVGPQGDPADVTDVVAGGDLSGKYPNPKVVKLQTTPISPTAPTNGQALIFDGTNWIPGSPTVSGGDNLGNHIATKNIQLNNFHLTNVGGTVGIALSDSGALSLIAAYRGGDDYQSRTVFKVDTSGGMLVTGKLSYGIIPASGAGLRVMWHPFRAGFRAGGVDQKQWDDENFGFYSTAFGHNTIASGFGAFAVGELCNATGTSSIAIGNGNTSSGTIGVALGASSVAEGFGSIAIGFTNHALGQGSVAVGYRCTSSGDFSVALGQRASSNTHSGCMVMGDESTTDSVRNNADNQFMARYAGGYVFYTKPTTNGSANLGAVLAPNSTSWSSVSDSTKKENFAPANGEVFLDKLNQLRLGSWNYRGTPVKDYRHYGAFAQEIFAAFGSDKLGRIGCDTLINSGDMDGIMLIMLQALNKRCDALIVANKYLQQQSVTLEQLQAENQQLKVALGNMQSLNSRLQQLEATLSGIQQQQIPEKTTANINTPFTHR